VRVASIASVTVSSLAVPLPAPATAARSRPRRRVLGMAGLYYLLGAVVVTMWLWRDPASRIVAGNPYDTDQFTWYFRYDAAAVAHFRLPALTTDAMNAPTGISVMWNTFMLLPGVLLAPVTLLAGPQVSLTVLMTAGFAGSALAMFAVLRRWGAGVAAAAAGGAVYGFSPALVQSSLGHYDLQFAVLPPLIADAALCLVTGRLLTERLAAGRLGTGRRPAAACGASLVGGYYMGPTWTGQAATDGNGLSSEAMYLNQLWAKSARANVAAVATLPAYGIYPDALQMRAQLRGWKVSAVVAVTTPASPLGRYLTGLLGRPAEHSGQVLAWRFSPTS